MAQESLDDLTPPYATTALPADAAATVRHIVLSYLVYHCYDDTAKSFAAAVSYGLTPASSAAANSSTADRPSQGFNAAAADNLTAADVILPLFQQPPKSASGGIDQPVRTTAKASRRKQSSAANSSNSSSKRPDTGKTSTDQDSMMDVDEDADTGGDSAMPDKSGSANSVTESTAEPAAGLDDFGLVSLVKSMDARKRLINLITAGTVDEAIIYCMQQFPGVMADVSLPGFVASFRGRSGSHGSKAGLSPVDSIGSATSYHSAASALSTASSSSTTASSTGPAAPPTTSLSPVGALDPLSISFQLHCLHFVELVRRDNQSAALQYAQQVLNKFGQARPALLDTLRDVVALIAYQDPKKSPIGALLDIGQRGVVAEAVNSAILAHHRLAPRSALESLVQQVTTVRDSLATELIGKDKKAITRLLRRWTLEELLQSDASHRRD